MKTSQRTLVLLVAIVLTSTATPAKAWHGIQPLHTTRERVEKLLGRGTQDGSVTVYKTREGLVEVRYAEAPCRGPILGWNVPKDVVLEVRVAPKKDNRPTDLKNFIQAVGHVPRPRYVNLRDGVALEFLPTGRIYSISFFPPERERGLRCSGFPPYDAGLTQYRPDESFGEIPISDQDAILDNFAFQFNGDASTKAYIIVYAGLRSRSTEALVVGNRIRNYLNAKRQIQMERLILVNGGYREMLEVELFAIPATMPKPTPRPTVPASDIRIIEQLK